MCCLQTSKEYQQEYDMRRGDEYSRFHGYTYDGVWTAALAIQEVARKVHQSSHDKGTLNRTIADFQYRDREWEDLFLEALNETSFEGVTVNNAKSTYRCLVEVLGKYFKVIQMFFLCETITYLIIFARTIKLPTIFVIQTGFNLSIFVLH